MTDIAEFLEKSSRIEMQEYFAFHRESCIQYFLDETQFQYEFLIEECLLFNPTLILEVCLGQHQGRNRWSTNKIIEWLKGSSQIIDIGLKASNKFYSSFHINSDIELCLFDLLIHEQKKHRDEIMQLSYLPLLDNHPYNYISEFIQKLPHHYRQRFEHLDEELFDHIMSKQVSLSRYKLPHNIAQYIYINMIELDIEETYLQATDFFIDYKKYIIQPLSVEVNFYPMSMDIFEYYLRNVDGNNFEGWRFFYPLTALYEKLNPTQQEMFVAVAFSYMTQYRNSNGELCHSRIPFCYVLPMLNSADIHLIQTYYYKTEDELCIDAKTYLKAVMLKDRLENKLSHHEKVITQKKI